MSVCTSVNTCAKFESLLALVPLLFLVSCEQFDYNSGSSQTSKTKCKCVCVGGGGGAHRPEPSVPSAPPSGLLTAQPGRPRLAPCDSMIFPSAGCLRHTSAQPCSVPPACVLCGRGPTPSGSSFRRFTLQGAASSLASTLPTAFPSSGPDWRGPESLRVCWTGETVYRL